MPAPRKSLSSAYGWAVVGILLGVLGMHRFYVRRYLSATLQTALFLIGVVIFVGHYFSQYYGLLNAAVTALSAGGSAGSIPDLSTYTQSSPYLPIGMWLLAAGGVWWLVDLTQIPKMVNQFNHDHPADSYHP